MAKFKGGFRFNNGSAAVEVEQNADGSLVSCRNPITGESIGGNSDFRIVEVKFVRGTVDGDVYISAPYVDYWPESDFYVAQIANTLTDGDNEITLNVILYRGHAAAFANDENAVLVGDNYDSSKQIITGPGTITINAG